MQVKKVRQLTQKVLKRICRAIRGRYAHTDKQETRLMRNHREGKSVKKLEKE